MTEERAVPGTPEWGELAAPHLSRYLFAVDFAQQKRVLDAGCGSGYGAALLKKRGAEHVEAIDSDAETIRLASERYSIQGVSFVLDDCQTLEKAAGLFGLICNFENIEHLPYPERFLEAAARRLEHNGVLLVSTPDRAVSPPYKQGKPANPYHVQEWHRADFITLLSRYFACVDMRTQVQTTASLRRAEGVAALRQRMAWGNPLINGLWRKFPWYGNRQERPWKKLAGLAATSAEDFPIVEWDLAPLFGTPCFHFALCRQPII